MHLIAALHPMHAASDSPSHCLQDGAGKKKEAAAVPDIDGISIDELNQKIATLEKEKAKEEEYRNYMQLERVRDIHRARLSRRASGCLEDPIGNMLSSWPQLHSRCRVQAALRRST